MHEPFAHILTRPNDANDNLLRFVTDEEVGATIQEPDRLDARGRHHTVIRVDKILTSRPAKGDWSKWPKHPTYYEAKGTILGMK